MCGITGLWATIPDERGLEVRVERMTRALAHRGPDDEGFWFDRAAGVGLGHRRLSVIETSAAGHQPMKSESGRWVIVFNGEIYNYRELARELGSSGARADSDTAVLIDSIERWGVEAALDRFVGMFAFAAFDTVERRLVLARDRLGKKPLYFGRVPGGLGFSSQLHSFRAAFPGAFETDPSAVSLLTRFGFIPEPWSIHRGIQKLRPGTFRSFGERDSASPLDAREHVYWDFDAVVRRGVDARSAPRDEKEAIAEAGRLVEDAVRLRMRSDVPFGAFLSGGIDSSLVVAAMQSQSSEPVRTFSIGYREGEFDEAGSAAAVAAHLGTAHTEFTARPEDVQQLVGEMSRVYDEPFADSSQLPTFLVSRLARRHVTVVLTGDGGDEVFAGYNRHVWGERLWSRLARVPAGLRQSLGRGVLAVPPGAWERVGEWTNPLLPERYRVRQASLKAQKFARLAQATSHRDMHLMLASHWLPSDGVLLDPQSERTRAELGARSLEDLDVIDHALWFDTVQGLPGDMLVKVDRATMAVGLEARQPLLDHRLVEFAWSLPPHLKVRDGVGKWILREVLAQSVPRALFERPKQGFGVPIGEWMRGPLRPWVEDLLAEKSLKEGGIFDARVVRETWDQHLSGRENHDQRIWIVLMMQEWLRATKSSSTI